MTLSQKRCAIAPAMPVAKSDEFRSFICSFRARISESLKSLPAPFRSMTQAYYKSRIGRAKSQTLLGEQLPFLIGKLLAVPPQDVEDISAGWFHMYLSVLVLDDILDSRKATLDRDYVFLAPILQQRAAILIAECLPHSSFGLHAVESAFHRTAKAGYHELQKHRAAINAFTKRQIPLIGDKMSLTEALIDLLTYSSNRGCENNYSKMLKLSFSRLQVAIQLLDDLTDIEEDISASQFTFPITVATLFKSKRPASKIVTFSRIVESGALSQTLRLASGEITSGLRELMPLLGPEAVESTANLQIIARNALLLASEASLLAASMQLRQPALSQSKERIAIRLKHLERRVTVFAQISS